MSRNYCLFIDESGLADPRTYQESPYFILSGCLEKEDYGIPKLKISHQEVKERLTSLNFVTKLNRDSEEEIADLMAYGARIRYELEEGKLKKEDLNDYQRMIVKSLEKRLVKISSAYRDRRKRKIARRVKPFLVLPIKKTG